MIELIEKHKLELFLTIFYLGIIVMVYNVL